MADNKIQFPDSSASPFTDGYGQIWVWNDVAWVRKGVDPGVEEAPQTGQQYARINPYDKVNPQYPGTDPETGEPYDSVINLPPYWELVQADEWYLGAHETPPTVDSYGRGLVEGHTYYDLPSHTMMVWDSVEWDAFSGVSEIATLWEYRFDNVDLSAAGTTAPVTLDVNAGDDHGNQPFDAWIKGLIVLSVYVDGVRTIERRTLTDSYEDIPARPSDEEQQIAVSEFAFLPVTGENPPVSYITLDTGYTWVWDGSAYQRGGAELDRYDYTVDYAAQTVTFIQDFTAASTIVIETGTLAASQYIKTSYENASQWEFVHSDCDMGGDTPDKGKLVTEDAIACFVKAQVEDGIARATVALIGSTFSYAGLTPPPNALSCDGQEVSIAAYPILYARLGNTWDTFNGATAPDSNNFRVPPQEVMGAPLYYAGTMGATPVGSYLAGTNKDHSHSLSHSHTGSVSTSTGSHDHYVYFKTDGGIRLGGGKTMTNVLITKAQYDAGKASGSIHYFRTKSGVSSAGTSGSSVTISTSNAGTSSQGGTVARPNTAILLSCIWADIQD